jgi:hypothetical protein
MAYQMACDIWHAWDSIVGNDIIYYDFAYGRIKVAWDII